MVLTIVTFGLILPFTPLAGPLKFAPRHCLYYLFLAGVTFSYLRLAEIVRRVLMKRWLGKSA
jgi:Mg2+-importing ATPase